MLVAPRVNFMIAGVQKGGTTALFDYLGDYPDIARSDVKEVHFFDDEGQDWAAPDYEAYHRHFPSPDGRPCGEATPIYSYWPKSLERIRAYNSHIQLILVLRDPGQRAWSHWRMETGRGAEQGTFSWCIREGRQRLFANEPWGHHREFSYVERGFYGEQVERIFKLFSREQVLVLQNERLRSAPDVTLAQVRQFLGLDVAPPPAAREVHVGRETPEGLPSADAAYLAEIYAADQLRLQALTGVSYTP